MDQVHDLNAAPPSSMELPLPIALTNPDYIILDNLEAGMHERASSAFLNQVCVFLLKEHVAKKVYINCPQNMLKCSIHVRPTLNPDMGKYALIMSPTLRGSELACNSDIRYNFTRPMNFIIWNCRGTKSQEFRLAFKEILDNYKPVLVVLLEIHRENHQSLPTEFSFSNVAAVPAEGQAGGMAILWHDDVLHVTDVALTRQEIYCMVKVVTSTTLQGQMRSLGVGGSLLLEQITS